ncbi:MAG: AAA family ATPase [Erysipelotrichales bacterium]|nr:AAA family ATPase [Erysipelotrichales bacterium]
MNPKIYFKIADGALIPTKKQSAILDSIFCSSGVIKKNIKNYNQYTKDFIESRNGSYEVYSSIDYSWNPNNNCFDFNKIETISEEEYFTASSYITSFDPTQQYDFPKSEKIDIKKLRKKISDVKNIKIDKNFIKNILDTYPCPSIEESGMYIDNFTWKYLVRNILKKKNTILVGPTGTGKTEIILKISEILNIPCYVHDMGAMQDPLTDLLGSHRLENGSSIFDYAKFTQEIQEPCIIVLDELSRAPLMANNILFPCLDSRRELPVEIADSKSARNIKIHPDCVFIATANIGIEYSGTNDIDAALMNRFLPLQLKYIEPEHEINVLINRTGISKEEAIKIVNFANRIRKDYQDEVLTKSCSTRETIAMAEMVADGFEMIEAFRSIIVHKYSEHTGEEIAYIQRLLISL